MVGNQLDVNVYIIAGSVVSERNIVKTIANAGFEVEGLVVQSLASSMVALKQEERDSGVLLIDIGGGTTDIIVFVDGLVRHSEVVSIGGDHVTNDISIGLRVSIPIAERIKRKHACALKSMVGRDEEFFVEGAIGKDKIRMSRKKLAEIVEMRMEEAFGIIKKRVERYEGLLSSGVVLTGGCCNLPGVRELAKSKLKMAVRIGKPLEVSGLAEILDSPVSTTCVGLVKFGFTYGSELKYFSFSPINLLKKVFSYGISLFRRKIFYKKEG
ncbi:MAG: cell division protein FtsA, partial [Candidatus Aureabacteria bacterium]|nr:cell division protein FtsA [Candidatus Auribacterota bacterium]